MQDWLNEFEKLELFQHEEHEEQDFKILEKVFTSNNYDESALFILDSRYTDKKHIDEPFEPLEIPLRIQDGKINLYRYIFQRPQDPTDEELKAMRKLGSFFTERTGLLYWWIKKFAEHKGIYVKRGYNRYLKLYDNNDNDVFVKCGELLGDDLCTFMSQRNEEYNKLIVVPFVSKEEYQTIKEIEIYMIEYTPEYLNDFNQRANKRLYEALKKIQKLKR